MEPLDLSKLRELYSARQAEAEKVIHSITDLNSDDFPDYCYLEYSGKYNHDNYNCPINSLTASIDSVCPFEEWDVCNKQLRWIQTMPFLSCYFRNPAGARSQNILNSINGHGYIHDYK